MMFGFKRPKPKPVQPGINVNFDTRLANLKFREYRIAYFSEDFTSNTFRYRCLNPSEAINTLSQDISASCFSLVDAPHIENIAKAADQLVICRTRYDENIQRIIDCFKKLGKSVFFDIDDLIFNTSYAKLVANSIGYSVRNENEWNSWFAYMSRHEATMRMCDGCITTNTTLAKEIERHTNLPTKVMRNFLNHRQESYSDELFYNKASKKSIGGHNTKIGYFSGTPTHAEDFKIAYEGICSAMHSREDIQLLLVGHVNHDALDKAHSKRTTILKPHDPITLQKLINSVDINIAPLNLNIFTECKSELKFFEAGIVGTITIASPSKVYKDCIQDGENGLLADKDQWHDRIISVVDSRVDKIKMSSQCRDTAKTKYSWKSMLTEIKAANRIE
ncbi:MAG: glycosyltransferase [Leptothrix sp. (in: b-proteobacteria)]